MAFVTEPSRPVFLSYASQDAQAAQKICATLRAAGIEVWFDQSELRGGDVWDQKIRREIRDCALFIPIISANTASRHEGYFRLEWNLADQRTHMMARNRVFIVPVSVDSTAETGADVPESFQRVQWTRLAGGETPAAFVGRVRRLLAPASPRVPGPGYEGPPALAAGTPPREVLASESWSQRSMPIAAAVVVLGTLAYLATDKLWISRSSLSSPTVAASAAPAAFTPPPHSIAVLPFTNLSGDPKQEYFSDGITEELLNALSRLNDLEVMARTSSFSFKGQNVDIQTIAHKLNVGAVLEGSVRRDGNNVRITVQLINAVTGFHLWSQNYDRPLTDILDVQTDVATSVARELEAKLVGDEAAKIEVGGTKNAEAYDAFLQGEQLMWSSGDSQDIDLRSALSAFDRAISLDPDYALAYARRAIVLGDQAYQPANFSSVTSLRREAIDAAERAVALAPDLAEAHLAVASNRVWSLFDFTGAAPEFERALALGSGNAHVQRVFADYSAQLGHFEQAISAGRRAIILDPRSVATHIEVGEIFSLARRFSEALQAYQSAKILDPGSHSVEAALADTLMASGQTERAHQLCESTSTPLDDNDRHHCLALTDHALGRQADAERELKLFQALDGDASAYSYASIYAQWGDKAAALQWLSKAERVRVGSLMFLKVDWALDPIRNEPQFKAIEERMNFPP